VEHVAQVIYESQAVTIGEISGERPQRAQTVEYELARDSIVFVQCGIFATLPSAADSIVDANYTLAGRRGDRLYALRTSNQPYACTIMTFQGGASMRYEALGAGCVLSSPAAHLRQARLLNGIWHGRKGPAVDEEASDLLRQLLTDSRIAPASKHEHVHTVRAIKELVNDSLSKPPSLPYVARQLYLSPFTVSRIFHNETGISLRRYIRRLRLRTALHMMSTRTSSLTNIAVELGFYDEAHFSKAFSAEFGSPPGSAISSSNIAPSQPFAAWLDPS